MNYSLHCRLIIVNNRNECNSTSPVVTLCSQWLIHTKSINPHNYYRDDKNNEYYHRIDVLFPQPLFVAAVMPRLYAERGVSGHPTLKLVDEQDAYCRWTVAYWRTAMREEAEGLPVPVRKTTPFKNTKTTTFFTLACPFLFRSTV